jgi:protein-S-isoprenylcysteine O-methyltransferase Ste14
MLPTKGLKRCTQSKNWWIDVILFVGFLLAFFLSFTGIALHQWIGVLGGLLAGFHLLLHWSWFDTVSQRFWQGISHNVRFNTCWIAAYCWVL